MNAQTTRMNARLRRRLVGPPAGEPPARLRGGRAGEGLAVFFKRFAISPSAGGMKPQPDRVL